MTCYALFHGRSEPCNISEHRCPVEEVTRTKRPVTLEQVHHDKDGTARLVEIHAYPIFDTEGNVSQVIRYSLDITDRKKAEEALLQSKRMLSTILDTSPVSIALSRERRIEWANEAWKQMFGFEDEQEYLGKNARMLYPSDEEYLRVGKALYQGLETGKVAEADVELRRKDGSVLYGHVRLRALEALDPSKGFILAVSDITFRKQAEIELEKLALIVQNTNEFIALSDLNERLIFINETGGSMVGISPERVGQHVVQDLVSESYQDQVKTEVIPKILEEGCWEGFLQLRHLETGRLIDTQAMTFLIRDPGTKQPLYLANVALDITQRMHAEQKLRESEQQYRSLFEQSIDGVYVTTREGKFIAANQSLLEINGYSREELLTINAADLYVDPDGRAKFQEQIEQWGHVKDYPLKLRRKDGKEIDCLLSASLRQDEGGQIIGYHGILRDVTESKRLEDQYRQAQKMESLGTMAGGIAHDFNNLLTIIHGYSELLLGSKTEGDPDYEDLEKILSTSLKGADLVRRILTFSRKVEVRSRPIDLNQQVKQSAKLLERTIPKMIAIDLHLADDLKRVHADPGQMEQVLLNLAVNAQHVMPDGGTLTLETENVTLDEEYCRTHLEAEPGEYVMLSVSDSGHGMEREVQERIFEPFYTTKETGKGTGLGLAMVYGIITGHGGSISCYSEPGHGTTFKMYLPAIEKETGSVEAARKEMIKGGAETILVVDDEDLIRDLGSRLLAKSGYRVIGSSNGREALEVYQERGDEIDLILLDLIMPEMGGRQCLEGLLRLDPSVKVVIASGYLAEAQTWRTLAAGAKGFVRKPYDIRHLLKVVREVLDSE
jgi:two-component system cell cycle sensor histidine kinase/response regulator CckA